MIRIHYVGLILLTFIGCSEDQARNYAWYVEEKPATNNPAIRDDSNYNRCALEAIAPDENFVRTQNGWKRTFEAAENSFSMYQLTMSINESNNEFIVTLRQKVCNFANQALISTSHKDKSQRTIYDEEPVRGGAEALPRAALSFHADEKSNVIECLKYSLPFLPDAKKPVKVFAVVESGIWYELPDVLFDNAMYESRESFNVRRWGYYYVPHFFLRQEEIMERKKSYAGRLYAKIHWPVFTDGNQEEKHYRLSFLCTKQGMDDPHLRFMTTDDSYFTQDLGLLDLPKTVTRIIEVEAKTIVEKWPRPYSGEMTNL